MSAPLNLNFTTQPIPIPQGQNYMVVSGLGLPWVPSAAYCYTMSGPSGTVIWGSVDADTLTSQGATFNLSGAPIDDQQTLIAVFLGSGIIPPVPIVGGVISNVGSQLDRAVTAYLISNGVGKWKVQNPGDCTVSPADGLAISTYPHVIVLSHSSTHDPAPTGDEAFMVRIICKFGVAGARQQANPYAARVARDAIVGLMLTLMLQTDDNATLDLTAANITAAGRALAADADPLIAANNADMANFTALHVGYHGTTTRGDPDQEGCAWVEIREFRITACPTAIDMS